jgi:uncharacterized repeat protein (TIGR01451 family)
VTLSNVGAAPLDVMSLAVGSPFGIYNSDCPATLDSGSSCTLEVVFSPTTIGAQAGVLTVTTNAASSPDSVTLSGNGSAPGLLINKTASPSLRVAYHGPVTFTIVLSNTGVSDAAGVLLTDTLPVSVTFARWVTRPTGTNLTADQLTWSGSVTAGQAIRLEWGVTHTGDYGERVSNVAQYSHASSSGSAQATFSVEPNPIQSIYLPIIINNWAGRPIYLPIIIKN